MPSKRASEASEVASDAPDTPKDASDAPETPTEATNASIDPQTPAAPAAPDTPTPASETAPQPRRRGTPPETEPALGERGLGDRGRVVGSNKILSSTPEAFNAKTRTTSRRRTRVLTIPPATFARLEKSGINRADLLLIAASRHAHQLQDTPRRRIRGRARLCVSLDDEEYSRLVRVAKRRGWRVSPTAAALIELYLDELDEKRNKKPKRPRAQR